MGGESIDDPRADQFDQCLRHGLTGIIYHFSRNHSGGRQAQNHVFRHLVRPGERWSGAGRLQPAPLRASSYLPTGRPVKAKRPVVRPCDCGRLLAVARDGRRVSMGAPATGCPPTTFTATPAMR